MNVLKNAVLTLIGFSVISLPAIANPIAPGDMVTHCRREAATYFGTGLKYIETEKVDRNQNGSYSVKGTADLGDGDKPPFQCNYDKNGRFKGIVS